MQSNFNLEGRVAYYYLLESAGGKLEKCEIFSKENMAQFKSVQVAYKKALAQAWEDSPAKVSDKEHDLYDLAKEISLIADNIWSKRASLFNFEAVKIFLDKELEEKNIKESAIQQYACEKYKLDTEIGLCEEKILGHQRELLSLFQRLLAQE